MPTFPLPLSLPRDDIFPPDFPNKIEVIINRLKTWSMKFACTILALRYCFGTDGMQAALSQLDDGTGDLMQRDRLTRAV